MNKEFDTYFAAAAKLLVKHQSASTSLLQRKFMIGYNRAGRIREQLEAQEIITPAVGTRPGIILYDDLNVLDKKLKSLNLDNQIEESKDWNKNL